LARGQKQFIILRKFTALKGLKVALSIHLEAKTAYLCKVLAAGGAEMYITGSNPLSTQDDVAAGLVHDGLNVFAWHGATDEEYHRHISEVVKVGPNIIIDDGGDLVNLIHNEYPELIPNVIGGCEETTTGIIRLIAMNKDGQLKFPMMLVNNAKCKYLFDNRYGTGQSVWDGINRTTNLIVAGKNVVVAGYGWCGKGVAMRAKGLGASVIVCEVDPIKAMEAVMDGFKVMKMVDAAKVGDFFVTVTGCKDVITEKAKGHIHYLGRVTVACGKVYKSALADNIQPITVWKLITVNIVSCKLAFNRQLFKSSHIYLAIKVTCVTEYSTIFHVHESFLSNNVLTACYSNALSAAYLVKNKDKLTDKIVYVPDEIDKEVANRKLRFWELEIDKLTPEQEKYLNSWQV